MFENLKKENIVEYVIFMNYLHDLVRVHNFNIQLIMEKMIGKNYHSNNNDITTINDWFSDFISSLKNEDKVKSGLLSEVQDIIGELKYLHHLAINEWKDEEYIALYEEYKPLIDEYAYKQSFKQKSDIELMIHSLYMIYLFRIQGKSITSETEKAIIGFKKMLSILALKYKFIKGFE